MKPYLFLLLPIVLLILGCGQSGSSTKTSDPSTPAPEEISGYGCDIPNALSPAEQRPLLVVRVNYTDIAFRDVASAWSEKIFGNQPHELNDYYANISYGRFQFKEANETDGLQDGIVTVALDKNHPDYDINDNNDFIYNFQPDLKAALERTVTFVDYAAYDKNGDGAIASDELIIMFILAGNEDAFSGDNDTAGVWAHSSCMSSQNSPVLDGTRLMQCTDGGNYAVFGERHTACFAYDSNNNCITPYDGDATVGIIAHELGHAVFNLPDLYDTSGASAGIGYFGLMGAGMWGLESAADLYAFGKTPVSMTAWSKVQNGWIAPEIISDANETATAFNDTVSDNYNIALLPISDHECFMVENRSTNGYDAGLNLLPGTYRGGLAIWHIDQDIINAGKLSNTVNADASHKGVDLEEAASAGLDDSSSFPGDAHNLFWLGNKTEFSNATDPNSRRYDGSNSGAGISSISEAAPVMSATIANPNKVIP